MFGTQNETFLKAEGGKQKAEGRLRSSFIPHPSAFTLVELLVVITIIGILAALITGAALNALNKAKQAAITLELQQIGNAIDNYKNVHGAYPPNAISPAGASTNSSEMNAVRSDLVRAIKKAFPRNIESNELINKLIGDSNTSGYQATTINFGGPLGAKGTGPNPLPSGMTAAEAIVLWLGGFSKDATRPFSGPGGPAFTDNLNNNDGIVDPSFEVLENRNWADGFEFDLGRLGPRNDNGQFSGRFIVYTLANSAGTLVDYRINLWTYIPNGSQQPIVYFDTSSITPDQRFNGSYNYELRSSANPNDDTSPILFPLRQPLETATVANPTVALTKYVNQGKFQLLHCGTDDIWGDFSEFASDPNVNLNPVKDSGNTLPAVTLVPTGPFLGDVADTVGNFMSGTLENEQE